MAHTSAPHGGGLRPGEAGPEDLRPQTSAPGSAAEPTAAPRTQQVKTGEVLKTTAPPPLPYPRRSWTRRRNPPSGCFQWDSSHSQKPGHREQQGAGQHLRERPRRQEEAKPGLQTTCWKPGEKPLTSNLWGCWNQAEKSFI